MDQGLVGTIGPKDQTPTIMEVEVVDLTIIRKTIEAGLLISGSGTTSLKTSEITSIIIRTTTIILVVVMVEPST